MNYISLLYNNITTTASEVNDDFTILWILISGILVFFMQAGFTLLESGMTQSKNADSASGLYINEPNTGSE